MEVKNKYKKVAHFSERKMRLLLRCFAQDLTASNTSVLCGLSRPTVNKVFNKLRERLFSESQSVSQQSGIFELDESYFGARRVRGKRGRGAAGKTSVFGLLKRNGKVFVTIVANCSKDELLPVIQGKILEGSTVHTDGWKAYDGLILNGYDHYRVFHSHNEFARGKCHVNGIESFWSFAKRRLAKFNGITDEKFILHLKETEYRFNSKEEDLYKLLLKLLRQNLL